jgi:hypothetical protein
MCPEKYAYQTQRRFERDSKRSMNKIKKGALFSNEQTVCAMKNPTVSGSVQMRRSLMSMLKVYRN